MSDLDHNAADAPPPAQPAERTISPIAGRLGAGRAGRAAVVAALVLGCGVFVAATWHGAKPHAATAPEQPARQVVPFEPLAAPTLANPGPGAPALTPAGAAAVPASGGAKPTGDPAAQARTTQAAIRGAPLMAYSRDGGPLPAASSGGGPIVPAIEAAARARPPNSTCCGAGRRSARCGPPACPTATS